jgi:hypothetical protein
MTISRPWQMLVALAQIADGIVCLITLTLFRPSWSASARMAGLQSMCSMREGD